MRVPPEPSTGRPVASAAVSRSASNSNNNHNHHNHNHSNNNNTFAGDIMSNALSEQFIFSPGAMVEVDTCHQERITGEVLAFQYDARLLVLKSTATSTPGSGNNSGSGPSGKSSDVTIVNLNLVSKVNILAEPDPERIAAELEKNSSAKMPDIDLKKLEDRLNAGIHERKLLMEAYKNGAGIEGISLYARLTKTLGQSFSITWDADSIIFGKNVRIEKPYGANNITPIRASGPKSPPNVDSALKYAKQMVEKYWRDQQRDPITLAPLNAPTAAAVVASAKPAASVQQPPVAVVAPTPVVAPAAVPAAPKPPATKGGPTSRKASPNQAVPKGTAAAHPITTGGVALAGTATPSAPAAPAAPSAPTTTRTSAGPTSYASMI